MLIIIQPFVVLGMDVVVVAPLVVVQHVRPLEPIDGPPSMHENHTNHPHHHNACVHVGFLTLLSHEAICSFLI
jgi:hypothetical protein